MEFQKVWSTSSHMHKAITWIICDMSWLFLLIFLLDCLYENTGNCCFLDAARCAKPLSSKASSWLSLPPNLHRVMLYFPNGQLMFNWFSTRQSKSGSSFYKQHPGWHNILYNNFRAPLLISHPSIAKSYNVQLCLWGNLFSQSLVDQTSQPAREEKRGRIRVLWF